MLLLGWMGSAKGQNAGAPIPPTAQDALLAMASQAGVIFAGHVVSISRSDASGFVDVRFHVDQAVRGVARTGAYVLREWAGLWSGQAERYHVGQGYLMLLTGRGSSGMSAPVGGMDGAIPLVGAVQPPLARGTGTAPPDAAVAAAELQIDLRWVNARTTRAAGGATQRTVRSSPPPVRAPVEEREMEGGPAGTGIRPMAASPIVAPIGSPVAGGDLPARLHPVSAPGSDPGQGWVGPIAPLGGAAMEGKMAVSLVQCAPLSSVLQLLQSGSGSVHAGR